MKPMVFSGFDHVLGAPPDWSRDEPCEGLPVAALDGCYVSHWRPSWRERLAILFGAGAWLWVVGRSHPPVAISVGRATLSDCHRPEGM